MDKIATELDQSSSDDNIRYWTQDPTEYTLKGYEDNPAIPNPREEVLLLGKLESEDILRIESNHGEYE